MLTPTDRFIATLQGLAASGASSAQLLFTQLVTLTNHYEILDGAVWVGPGEMVVSSVGFNNMATAGRTVPLSRTASDLFAGEAGDAAQLLGLPTTLRGALVAHVRKEIAAMEIPPVDLEGFRLIACHALLHEADGQATRQAVLAYAGLPAQSARAVKQRAQHLPGSLNGVAVLIDELVTRAGLIVRTQEHARA